MIKSILGNSNEERNLSESAIYEMKEQNFYLFIQTFFEFLLSKNTGNLSYIHLVLAIIFNGIETNNIVKDDEFFNFIMEYIHKYVYFILSNNLFDDIILKLISQIISQISYIRNDDKISLFLMELLSNFPFYFNFVINMISEEIEISRNNHYEFEHLIRMILNNNGLFEPRFKLLIAIIPYYENSKKIYQIFDSFIHSIPCNLYENIIKILIDKNDILKNFYNSFLFDFLDLIVPLLNDDNLKYVSMIFILLLGCNSSENENIINEISLIFLKILNDDFQFSDFAIQCFGLLCGEIPLYNIVNLLQYLKAYSLENKTLPSFFLMISQIKCRYSPYFMENIKDLINIILLNINNDTDMLISGLKALSNLCLELGPNFQNEYFGTIFPLLYELLIKEKDGFIINELIKCLTCLFSKITITKENIIFDKLFEYMISILINRKNNNILVLQFLKCFINSVSSLVAKFLPALFDIFSQLVSDTLFYTLIQVMDLCIIKFPLDCIQYKNLFLNLLLISFQMRNAAQNENDSINCYKFILDLINFLGKESFIICKKYIPELINTTRKEIEITKFCKTDKIFDVPGYTLLDQKDTFIYFGNSYTIFEIEINMMLLKAIFKAIEDFYFPYIDETFEICIKWINNSFYIHSIYIYSWDFIDSIIIFTKRDSFINSAISYFINKVDFLNQENFEKICSVLLHSLILGKNIIDIDIKQLILIFIMIIENKSLDMPYEFKMEILFFIYCFKTYSYITGKIIQNQFLPFIINMLENENFQIFPLTILPFYYYYTNDLSTLNVFINKVISISANNYEHISSQTAIKTIGILCDKINVSQEIINLFLEHLLIILNQQSTFEDDLNLFYDNAIYSLTIILNKYSSFVNIEESIKILFKSLPMKTASKESVFVTSFVAKIIFNQPNELIESIGYLNILRFLLYHINTRFINEETNKIYISFAKKIYQVYNINELTESEKYKLNSLFNK